MQKQAPTLGRLLVMVGFTLSCFGLLLFLWLAFGGPIPLQPEGYRLRVSFPEATQLAQEADVRISGVPVGKVKTVEPSGGLTEATIELESRYAPLPSDAKAILRQKTLLGETYVELTPGTSGAKAIPEGGSLRNQQVSDTVELDEIFRAFDPETRANFQDWMQTQATAVSGRGQDISDALGNLTPFATNATQLLTILNRQEGAVQGLVSDTGEVLSALTERSDQLQGLITNSNRVFETTAARNQALAETFVALPTFQRETRATLNRLDAFASNTDPLVSQLRPAARELSPTLVDLDALSPDLRNLFAAVGPLISASERGLPATRRVLDDLQPLLGQLEPVLRQVNPPLYGLVNYRPELISFFANTVAATQATDRPPRASGTVHYLRTTNPVNPEVLAVYPRRLGTNRPNPYQLPAAFNQLATGLPVYENRHCGRPLPALTNTLSLVVGGVGQTAGGVTGAIEQGVSAAAAVAEGVDVNNYLPQDIFDEVGDFVFGTINNPGVNPSENAPACRQQIPYPAVGGTGQQGTSQYPREFADPPNQTPVNPAAPIDPRTGAILPADEAEAGGRAAGRNGLAAGGSGRAKASGGR